MTMPHLTAVILTRDERRHIVACIESLRWADEIVVFDSLSEDGTPDLARSAGARVLSRRFDHFAGQRNAALDALAGSPVIPRERSDRGISMSDERAEGDIEIPRAEDGPRNDRSGTWVFFVDADERCTPALAAEVREVIVTRPEAGWWVPRRNYIVGRWIRHAGWYPDYQLRLFRSDLGRYDPAHEVHETVMLQGEAGYLQNTLTHFNYDTWRQFAAKQRKYLQLDAAQQAARGVTPHPWTYVLQPLREFRRRYVTLAGYRDGWHGLVLSLLMAYTAFLTTMAVGRLRRQRPTASGNATTPPR